MGNRIVTEEEFNNIKLMADLKTSVICKITGRSDSTIERIKCSNTWEDYVSLKNVNHSQKKRENKEKAVQIDIPSDTILDRSKEDLMRHITDSIDYNNALNEKILKLLGKLCFALGVKVD